MTYTPATDFVGLFRNSGGNVSKLELPGLDFVIAALGRAGIITLSVSATAPVANQSTTAWLQAAVPSYSGEGTFQLWNGAAYAPATSALFLKLLQAVANQNGVSWYTSAGGPPLNTVGNNGDFALRTDQPGGIYGPKTAGAWPATPLPGTTTAFVSADLDAAFGPVEGNMVVRGPTVWQALAIGAANTLLGSSGLLPQWETLSALLDAVMGNAQGDILYRDATLWKALAPGVAGQSLLSGGAGANPSWSNHAEFPSGTNMVFQQSSAPTGWTKQTAINDYGLRVVSGAASSTAGVAFSTVFSQTQVGGHAISINEMPAHNHTVNSAATVYVGFNHQTLNVGTNAPLDFVYNGGALTVDNKGGGAAHVHSVSLNLSYVDVIIASKN